MINFDWIIGPPKYSCEVVEWAEGFNKKYSKFNFGHWVASNLSFDYSEFLFGPSLVGANGFLQSQDVYLGSDFGTSTLNYNIMALYSFECEKVFY